MHSSLKRKKVLELFRGSKNVALTSYSVNGIKGGLTSNHICCTAQVLRFEVRGRNFSSAQKNQISSTVVMCSRLTARETRLLTRGTTAAYLAPPDAAQRDTCPPTSTSDASKQLQQRMKDGGNAGQTRHTVGFLSHCQPSQQAANSHHLHRLKGGSETLERGTPGKDNVNLKHGFCYAERRETSGTSWRSVRGFLSNIVSSNHRTVRMTKLLGQEVSH